MADIAINEQLQQQLFAALLAIQRADFKLKMAEHYLPMCYQDIIRLTSERKNDLGDYQLKRDLEMAEERKFKLVEAITQSKAMRISARNTYDSLIRQIPVGQRQFIEVYLTGAVLHSREELDLAARQLF